MAIKGQVLENVIAEFTPRASTQSDSQEGWILNIDGATNSRKAGIGVILITQRVPSSNSLTDSTSLP